MLRTSTIFQSTGLLAIGVAVGVLIDIPFSSKYNDSLYNKSVSQDTAKHTASKPLSTKDAPALSASPMVAPIIESTIYEKLARADQQSLSELASSILDIPESSHHRLAALDLLMQRWAVIDPEGALSFAYSLHGVDRDEAFRSALLFLGTESFEQTKDWMTKHMTASARQNSQIWLYTGLSRSNPQVAMDAIAALQYGRLKEDALMTVASDWAERDIYATFDWFETAPWNGAMFEVYKTLMDSYMRQYPEDALNMVEQMDDGYWKSRYCEDLIRQFASADPETALKITNRLNDAEQQASAINTVFEEWTTNQPELALKAAYQFFETGDSSEALINDVFRNTAFGMHWESPSLVRELYHTLPRNIRHEIVGPMVEQWLQEDPKQAESWVTSRPRDGIEYNLAMGSMAKYYEDWAPETAIRTANKIEYADIRSSTILSALRKMYLKDPTEAYEFAENDNLVSEQEQSNFKSWADDLGSQSMVFLIPNPSGE